MIFIADKDPEGEGEPLYRYDAMMDAKQGKLTPIAPTYIFVNGQYRNPATELGRMIADIMEADPSKMNTPILRKRMNMLKNTKAGRNSMRTALDEYIDQQVDQQVTEREENRLKQALFGLVMKGKITMTDAAETLEATETELWREFAAFVTATAT